MTKQYMTSKNKKKQRLKITNLNDLKQALLQEGYTEIDFEENTFKDTDYNQLMERFPNIEQIMLKIL